MEGIWGIVKCDYGMVMNPRFVSGESANPFMLGWDGVAAWTRNLMQRKRNTEWTASRVQSIVGIRGGPREN